MANQLPPKEEIVKAFTNLPSQLTTLITNIIQDPDRELPITTIQDKIRDIISDISVEVNHALITDPDITARKLRKGFAILGIRAFRVLNMVKLNVGVGDNEKFVQEYVDLLKNMDLGVEFREEGMKRILESEKALIVPGEGEAPMSESTGSVKWDDINLDKEDGDWTLIEDWLRD